MKWGPVQEISTPGKDSPAFKGDNVTYSNLFQLKSGRIVNFYRGFGFDPNYMYSDDSGRTWQLGGRLFYGRTGYGPYAKYAFDGDDTIHFVATEDHPRNFDNSLYHGFIHDGQVYRSDGSRCNSLSEGTDTDVAAWDLTRIFQGDADNVAWMTDLELDSQKRPCVVFTVQKDGRGLPPNQGGFDHRFYYARWDGDAWQTHEIAYAGTRLYAGEDDYTGLAAIDPQNTNIVYISTDADPRSGQPVISQTDGKQHHELFRGETSDGGAAWQWTAITANSSLDNLRPIVPKWNDPRTAIVWMARRLSSKPRRVDNRSCDDNFTRNQFTTLKCSGRAAQAPVREKCIGAKNRSAHRSLAASRSASTRHRARRTGIAAALPFGLFRAAAGAAAFDQSLGEFLELHLRLVCIGQTCRERFELGRHITQEIEEQPLAVKQVLHVDKHRRQFVFRQQRGTRLVRLVPIPFETRMQQFVLDGHAAQQIAIGKCPAVVAIVRRREHVADLQPAPRSHDHAAVPRIAHGVDGRKSTDLPHGSHAN